MLFEKLSEAEMSVKVEMNMNNVREFIRNKQEERKAKMLRIYGYLDNPALKEDLKKWSVS
jgi:hypothetical protein